MSPDQSSFAAVVAWLGEPSTYEPATFGSHPAVVEMKETHLSLVFLAGEHVYKLKKPLDLGFVDFRTLAAREANCAEEVRLNRRLAPGYYLGTRTITMDAAQRLAFDGEGTPVDCVVVMRRLPTEESLDVLIRSG